MEMRGSCVWWALFFPIRPRMENLKSKLIITCYTQSKKSVFDSTFFN